MANYYDCKIEGEVTQELAKEVFDIISKKSRVRSFLFIEGCKVSFNTRGLNYAKEMDELLESIEEEFSVSILDEYEKYNEQ